MIYLALLRGINVGGQNKVEMARLRSMFEKLGSTQVRTFINSGNVIFEDERKAGELRDLIEEAIAEEFGFPVRIVVRDIDEVTAVEKAIPAAWTDDTVMRCYVMFLWEDVDEPAILERVIVKEGIDDVKYVPGAIIWRVDRADINRSGMSRLVSDALYKSMSIRNSNTVRKLAGLMKATED